jgi:hypothetical protein
MQLACVAGPKYQSTPLFPHLKSCRHLNAIRGYSRSWVDRQQEMGRRYDYVLMISRRAAQILWTTRKAPKRITEKVMDFSKPENRIKLYLWVMIRDCTQHQL